MSFAWWLISVYCILFIETRKMDKRYQVFVSSTYVDLKEERLEVIKALLELDCIPCGMEYFPAASEETWTYIQDLIRRCDYYVLVVGGRYGSLASEGVSYTQKEYEFALSERVPSIAFLHACPEDLPAKYSESSVEGQLKLREFISVVRRQLCKEWNTPEELGAVVSRSLTQLIRRHPRTGWIKADQASSSEATTELLALTRRVKELENELERNAMQVPVGAQDLSQGDELMDVEFDFTIYDSTKYRHQLGWILSRLRRNVCISWNKLFMRIAPILEVDASGIVVKNALGRLVEEQYDLRGELSAPEQTFGDVSLAEESLQRIKIQFTGLGLIRTSKQAGSQVARWQLTPLGRQRMFELLSVPRGTNAGEGLRVVA